MHKAQFYRHKLVVHGKGEFPVDMLRYATCLPASEHDSYLCSPTHEEKWDVTLHRFARERGNLPASVMARFLSFGWEVVSYKTDEA